MKEKFYGVYAALLTPFDEDGNVCEKRLKNLVKFLISKGINGLYVCGSTGEFPLMNLEERKRVAEIVKEEVGDKIKIIVHIGALSTRDTIKLAQHSEKIKVDAVSSVPPFYYNFSFEEIFNFYKELALSVSIPVFFYYIPQTTGIFLKNEQILKLGDIKNIIGLKFTYTDFYILQDLLTKMKWKWIAFSGPDELFLPALTMGVVGCIGSTQNILPEIFIDIYENFKKNDLEKAMKLQKRVTEAVELLHRYGGITSRKAALKLRGIDAGFAREPFFKDLPNEKKKMFEKEWLERFPEFSEGIK
ncbi:MAG: dihydrodipicolinate synthase family protein [Candidatus Omnitrophica bacterium]|nr:dihydrodipicolinate synthase family protein [Candidatus Omnitrophota bacterium]MCM8802857.1 dihydrodipicolinate synthase family protein [Candidatus Omnitrophota bacterium]